MKAAVMYENAGAPVCEEVPDPVPETRDEILVKVKAAALKHLDRGRATGAHYSASAPGKKGRVVGGDGVCILPDGTRVYAIGVSGMLAGKAVIDKERMAPLPENLGDAEAAALGNAIIGSAMALRFRAQIKNGDVVLINGATGFTGRVAVQIAKYYGASRVIATGRNENALAELLTLGADQVFSIAGPDEQIAARLKETGVSFPVDVVIDYLWGHTAELILASLKGRGHFTKEVRYVSVGSAGGDLIGLSAANLRSVNLQLCGSGLGSWTREAVRTLFSEILPEMFGLAAMGRLTVKTRQTRLEDVAGIWDQDLTAGERVVIMM